MHPARCPALRSLTISNRGVSTVSTVSFIKPRVRARPTTVVMAGKLLTADVDSFAAALDQLQTAPTPHYIVFNADPNPHTGLPWCPDCVRAVPAIKQAAARATGTLLEVTVGPRSAWKGNPGHPFRVAPELKLTGIPTLLEWGPSGATRRLGPELEACASPSEVERLLASSGFFTL